MLSSFLLVASQVVTLFLLMGVGFALAKCGKLNPDGVSQMAFLALNIAAPCIIIRSFQVKATPALALELLQFLVLFCLVMGICMLVAVRCFRNEPEARRGPLRFSLIYGNNGFMGLPLLLSILGQSAVIFGAVSVVAFNFLLWTHGAKTMGGKVTLRQVIVNPATVGVVVALPLFLNGWHPPAMINSAVGFVADLNTPLAMIVIGAQMAGADLKACFTTPKLYGAAAFRLIAAPLIPLILLLPMQLSPMLYCSCVIMCAVPAAGATGMLAQRFGRDTALAAQLVTLTTLLSVLTLPIFSVLAQYLSN